MNNIISIAADFSNDICYPTAYVVKGDTGNVFNISIHKDGADADLSDITLDGLMELCTSAYKRIRRKPIGRPI